jgi:uncharacterized Fe-S cluster-containing radical SAM superfamily protein
MAPGIADFRGQDLGPYWRFRKTPFYGGCFTADTMYCNWACDNCWSKMGWRTLEPKYTLDSDEVAKRLVRGIRRHRFPQARISGGETALLWDHHMRHVAAKFLEQTIGERQPHDDAARAVLDRGGRTRRMDDVFLVLETNGSVLTGKQVERFERDVGQEAERFQVTVGMKATSPALLSKLTGHSLGTAERFHRKQIELITFLGRPEGLVKLDIVLLDSFIDEEELGVFEAWLEGLCEGNSEAIDIQEFRTSGWGSQKHTERYYQPKRKRDQE